MKLALSNIAWDSNRDVEMYAFMEKHGFCGLEIAPTRLFPEDPYLHASEFSAYAHMLREYHGLCICAMQSLWYGRKERLFGSQKERAVLLDYTRRAIEFASAAACRILVLGSPKNRSLRDGEEATAAQDFFGLLAEYAQAAGCVLALEPNPALYGTNYINTTEQAAELCRTVEKNGFGINLDLGTVIENNETPESLATAACCIVHTHISEPNLAPLAHRTMHTVVRDLLQKNHYDGFVSVEMKNTGRPEDIKISAQLLLEAFA